MIPNEILYAVLGGILAIFFPRMRWLNGITDPKTGNGNTDQKTLIREVLLEILQNLTRPPNSPEAEIRKTLRAILEEKRNDL